MDIVTEDAEGHDAEGVAEPPVGPVVARTLTEMGIAPVEPRVVAAAQEVDGRVVEDAYHPLLELLEVGTTPALVVAHEFGGIGPFIAIDAGGERDVGVASQSLARTCPLHHDAHGSLGILARTSYFPAEGILVGHGCAARTVHVVLARGTSAYDRLRGPRGHAGLGIFVGTEPFPGGLDLLVSLSQQLAGTVYICLRHDAAGMHETMVIAVRKYVPGLIACRGLRLGEQGGQG